MSAEASEETKAGEEPDLRELGRRLDVQAVLTGRVHQSRDRLSVHVELVDVRDNRVLWGEQSFDEMGSVTEQVVAVHKEDEPTLQKFLTDRTRAAIQAGTQNGTAQRYLQQRASEN